MKAMTLRNDLLAAMAVLQTTLVHLSDHSCLGVEVDDAHIHRMAVAKYQPSRDG